MYFFLYFSEREKWVEKLFYDQTGWQREPAV